jgi:glycerophosphoryl diester phosphodiesterase
MRATMPIRLRRMLRPLPQTSATIYAPLITPRLVALARSLDVSLYAWTVDDLAEMRRLVAMGIDGITSNRAELLAQLPATQPAAS